jgi:preprotein translocase subunit Sss1
MNVEVFNAGQYADWIDQTARKPRQEFRQSVLGHQEAFEELAEVWEECRKPGWDGYGARAAEQETLRNTYQVIEALPLGFPRPSISAQPDGQLTLEWYRSPTRTLSISIDPDGYIHYAGLFGVEKHFGTVPFLGGLPAKVVQLASEV